MTDSTKRFSDRVANYVKYRPSYPQGAVDTLISECHINTQSTVADIGAGTGIFSELLLQQDLEVIGVEPNEDMRLKVGEAFQTAYDNMLKQYATDYNTVNHMNISDDDIADFFAPHQMSIHTFANSQQFDLPSFLGRMKSSSYTPAVDTHEHVLLLNAATALFEQYEHDGAISFDYETRLYIAQ